MCKDDTQGTQLDSLGWLYPFEKDHARVEILCLNSTPLWLYEIHEEVLKTDSNNHPFDPASALASFHSQNVGTEP